MEATKTPTILVDLDGTVADDGHRVHLIPTDRGKGWSGTSKNLGWMAHSAECHKDIPYERVIAHIDRCYRQLEDTHGKAHLVFLSGRDVTAEDKTASWLERYFDMSFDLRLRRPEDNPAKNAVFKHRVIANEIIPSGLVPVAMYDDFTRVHGMLELLHNDIQSVHTVSGRIRPIVRTLHKGIARRDLEEAGHMA